MHRRPPFRTTYWRNYPAPFYNDWYKEPIPGWGARPVMAGPARVGIGAIPKNWKFLGTPTSREKFAALQEATEAAREGDGEQPPPGQELQATPVWVWVAGAVAVGGVAALGFNLGWFGKR